MAGRKALILAGTGMLAGVAEVLTQEGWHVVLPSRRYRPLECEVRPGAAALRSMRPPGHRPYRAGSGRSWGGGKALWVEAHWDRPRELAAKAEAEIADGVLDAVRRALNGHASSMHQVGQLRPLVR